MIIKTYRTRELKGFSLLLLDENGKRLSISFKRGCTLGSTATYTTEDPAIQKALEATNDFGPTFYIEKEEKIGEDTPMDVKISAKLEPVVEEEKEVVDMLDAQTFKNLVELRNALADKGIDVSQITNVKAAENIAKKNGYNYTVEKNA
jgi:hypothetical protein